MILPLTGNHAVAEAMRQINPDVVAVYPITPQSEIVEKFSEFVANGLVDTGLINAESEHSALSACVGASASGARAMTATSSAGLAFMWEILGVASGLRLPIVMPVVNRALSAPINIHGDHSDSMGARDFGWVQIYSENPQEAYENTLLAVKLAEHKDVLLPAMVMQDGFITSHCVENVKVMDDKIVKDFIGEYKLQNPLLDLKNPVTVGPLQLTDYYFETKRQQHQATENAKQIYLEVGRELKKLTGNNYGYFEKYKVDDADAVVVTMSSTAGTTKAVVDKMRQQGKKVGLLKIKLFRPFPYKEVADALDGRTIGVLDRSMSFGAFPPLFTDVKNALFGSKAKIKSYVFGLGGRDIYESCIENIFEHLLEGKFDDKIKFVGLRE